MYLSRELTLANISEIANYFGGRHYIRVSHAVRFIEEKIRQDKKPEQRPLNRRSMFFGKLLKYC